MSTLPCSQYSFVSGWKCNESFAAVEPCLSVYLVEVQPFPFFLLLQLADEGFGVLDARPACVFAG